MALAKVSYDKIVSLCRWGDVSQRGLMSRMEKLELRVTVLESRMDEEAGLRASQDRDLSEVTEMLRAQKRSIQALHDTQSEHTTKLDEQAMTLARHGEKLDKLEWNQGLHQGMLSDQSMTLALHGEKLDKHEVKLDRIITLLDRLADTN